jgi:hypothetical protein
MKKLIFTFLLTSLTAILMGQNIILSPTGTDELQVTTYGSTFPTFAGRYSGGTSSSPTATHNSAVLGFFAGRGHTGAAFNSGINAGVGFYANQTFSPTGFGSSIRFLTTADNTTSVLERMRIAHNGNVGIGTGNPLAKLSVNGDMALQKIQRETSSGGFNDYDRQDASIAIFENGGTLGGITGGSEGQMMYVVSGHGNAQSALVIRHDSPLNPTAANRILTHTGADFTISSGLGGVLLIYDATKARWRIVETPSGSGTAGWGLTGNSGTNPATQFIGTTDAQPLAFKTNNTERIRILSGGNVGIGTSTPDAKLDVAGSFALSGKTLLTSSGTVNNHNLNGKSIIQVSGGENITLTGIAGGVEGMIVHIIVANNSNLTLANSSSLSLIDNRISTGSQADITISQGGGATLIYDSVNLDWIVIGIKN